MPGAIGITTACKDVEAAKRAVDFISSSKAQQIYADAQPGIYLNKNVKAELSPAHQDLVEDAGGQGLALWQGTGNNYGYGSYDKYVQDYYVGSKTVEQVLAAMDEETARMRLLQTTPTGPNKAAFGMGCGRRSPYPIFLIGCVLSMSKQNKSIYSYWLAVPCLILYGLFFIIPAVMGLGLSFLNIRSFDFSQATFAGLRNYINVLSDSGMNIAIKNSFIFAAVTTVLKVILGMVLAVFLNNKMRTTNFLRTVFFLPAVLSSVAVGLIFTAMMHPTRGIINIALRAAGLDAMAQNWLTDPHLAIFSVAFIEVWKWTGFTMVILLAGLQSIPKNYYEVADIDGATVWQKFRCVTFPLVLPAFTNALVVNLIGGLKAFDIVQAVTKGGPGTATEVFGTLVYKSFGSGRYGEGCAASIILCIVILAVVLPIYRYLTAREVEI
ncbi:MAG: ABC transporter permease subunit [Ruthenibacterium lactatiformans]